MISSKRPTGQIQNFNYQGSSIAFDFGNDTKMINATQMAKLFKKQAAHFLRSKQTQAFINALEKKRDPNSHNALDIVNEKILKIVQGGDPKLQGTWMHEKLALKFAAWLSPEFELWVYDRIQELLTTGQTTVEPITAEELMVKQANFLMQQSKKIEEIDLRLSKFEKKPRAAIAIATGSESPVYRKLITITDYLKNQCHISFRRQSLEIGEHAHTIPNMRCGNQNASFEIIEKLELRFSKFLPSIEEPKKEYFTILAFAMVHKIKLTMRDAKIRGKQASNLCAKYSITPGRVQDSRFGYIGSYPYDILMAVFELE